MESIINTHIPEFKVQAYHNGEFKTVTDKDVLGKWAVFFFYPADFTFVCPTELEDMAEKYEEFKRLGVEVYSVSTDSHFVHKAWHDTSDSIKKIQYPMLADPTGVLSLWPLTTARYARPSGNRGRQPSSPALTSWAKSDTSPRHNTQ